MKINNLISRYSILRNNIWDKPSLKHKLYKKESLELSKMAILTIIIIVVVVLILFYLIGMYNRFVTLKNGIESNLKQISVAMKKRMDLISQVVNAVKGEMKFEKSTLTEVTKLRSAFNKSVDPSAMKNLSSQSDSLMKGIMVQLEAYPNLKANTNVQQLIDTLHNVEDEISRLRYTFNNTVQEFNTKTQMFPSNIIAGMFGFNKTNYLVFDNEEEIKNAPEVNLDI